MISSNINVKTYFPALTGVRAIAAFLVFFFHFNPFSWKGHPGNSAITRLLGAVIGQWHIGVSIFFVLSGFLIATRYMDRIEPSFKWAKQYMLNRFARIYPVYFLLTAITFSSMIIRHTHASYEWEAKYSITDKLITAVASFTLTRAFFHSFFLLGLPTAWSLTVEECFYISAPFLLLVLRKRIVLLPVFGVIILGAGFILMLLSSHFNWYGEFMRPVSFVLYFTFFGRSAEFLVGIGLAFWLKKRGNAPARRGTTLFGIGLICLCLAGMVFSAWGYKATEDWSQPLNVLLINNFLLPFGVVFLFHGLINETSLIQKILASQVFDLLGKSSYAFYLIHLGLFADLLISVLGLHFWILFPVFNIISIIIYKLIEHPFHGFLLSKFQVEK